MHRDISSSEITGIWSYLLTIDWSEPWFLWLGIFHLFCALITVSLRSTGNALGLFFIFLLFLVYISEYVNTWAAHNWKLFSQQQYFDSNGLFISLLYSTPLLLNCLVIVVLWLWNAGTLLVSVKQLQLQKQMKQARKEEKQSTNDSEPDKKHK